MTDDNMLHAFDHPVSSEDLDDGFVMLVDPDRSGKMLEIGVVTSLGTRLFLLAGAPNWAPVRSWGTAGDRG